MNDKKIQTLDDIRAFLKGTTDIDFSIEGKDERCQWVRQTLVRFQYLSLNQRERGVVLRYLGRVSGYSRQTVTRLVAQYRKTGKVQRPSAHCGWLSVQLHKAGPCCWQNSMNCMAPPGNKPKGMHWQTFWKLDRQHNVFLRTSLDVMAQQLGLRD